MEDEREETIKTTSSGRAKYVRDALRAIEDLYPPGAKLTLIIRQPGRPKEDSVVTAELTVDGMRAAGKTLARFRAIQSPQLIEEWRSIPDEEDILESETDSAHLSVPWNEATDKTPRPDDFQ